MDGSKVLDDDCLLRSVEEMCVEVDVFRVLF